MKLVLGMAKSGIDTKGARSPKFELDFLRLLFAVRNVEEVEKCFFVVQNEKIKNTIKSWEKKYEMKPGEVITIAAELSETQKRDLAKEKANNTKGVIASMSGKENNGNSNANSGKDILEKKLKEVIELQFNTFNDKEIKVLGINWDYLGTITG